MTFVIACFTLSRSDTNHTDRQVGKWFERVTSRGRRLVCLWLSHLSRQPQTHLLRVTQDNPPLPKLYKEGESLLFCGWMRTYRPIGLSGAKRGAYLLIGNLLGRKQVCCHAELVSTSYKMACLLYSGKTLK